MRIGHENWHVEGMKRARVWAMDNIKVDLQSLGMRSLDCVQNFARWREIGNVWMKFRVL
jgi:hypothetical protein